MRLLLDTHVVLWGLNEPQRLSATARSALRSPDNESFVSVASLWEIAIKVRQGRLQARDDLPEWIEASPVLELLPVTARHAWTIRGLPRLHGDPFDQMLISQSLCEGMTLVTHDRAMAQYGVPIIAV